MPAGWWEYVAKAHFVGPKSDRELFRVLKRRRVSRLVEFGIGSIARATQIIRVCQRFAEDGSVSYAALDWFEERPAGLPTVKLIEAHRQLKATGAEVRLMPGGPTAGLPGIANALTGTQLVVVSPDADERHLAAAWFYLPRMLAADALVLRGGYADSDDGDGPPVVWSIIPRAEIDRSARANPASAAA